MKKNKKNPFKKKMSEENYAWIPFISSGNDAVIFYIRTC